MLLLVVWKKNYETSACALRPWINKQYSCMNLVLIVLHKGKAIYKDKKYRFINKHRKQTLVLTYSLYQPAKRSNKMKGFNH